MLNAFLHGIFLALGLIMPLGMQNIFIFNQGAMQKPFYRALPSVFTAFICDALLIIFAILGLSLLVYHLIWLKELLFIIGFLFLLYMGYVTWNADTPRLDAKSSAISAKKQVVFSASVSLLNPHAIIDTTGVIGANALHYGGINRWVYALGCIFVSFTWFLGLAVAGHNLHKIDSQGFYFKFVNKLSALIIWSVAIYVGFSLVQILTN